MKSSSKNILERELLEHITKNAFGVRPISITQLNDGLLNATYKVEVPGNRCAVLKVAPRDDEKVLRYEKNMMYTEVSVMQKIKRHTDVPVPDLYYFDAAHTSCPADYLFMEYIDAPTYSSLYDGMTSQERSYVKEQIGHANYRINQIKGHRFGYYGQERRQKATWYEAFSRMLEDILTDAKYYNVPLGLDEAVFYKLLERDETYFEDVTEPVLVHWRLWERNCYLSGCEIVGITDWEHCLWADPLMEFGFRTEYRTPEFMRGYGKDTFTERERRRMLWYDFYMNMTMLVEAYARAYADTEYRDRMWEKYNHMLELVRKKQV